MLDGLDDAADVDAARSRVSQRSGTSERPTRPAAGTRVQNCGAAKAERNGTGDGDLKGLSVTPDWRRQLHDSLVALVTASVGLA